MPLDNNLQAGTSAYTHQSSNGRPLFTVLFRETSDCCFFWAGEGGGWTAGMDGTVRTNARMQL